ncbi:MAG: primosomal protein N' [Lutimonas sp.]
MFFTDVILPIPLEKAFTYAITQAEASFMKTGMRVAVPFGNSKIYTGIVYRIHQEEPTAYEAKQIYQILDEAPVLTTRQLTLWEWMAGYYMCSLGEVLRAALPNAFLIESETWIHRSEEFEENENLSHDESLVVEALEHQSKLKVEELGKILERKSVLPLVRKMIEKNIVEVKEEIFEKYRPKWVKYVQLNPEFAREEEMHRLLDELERAPQQRIALMSFFSLRASDREVVLLDGEKWVSLKKLKKSPEVTPASVQTLIKKEILQVEEVREDRVSFGQEEESLKELSSAQVETLNKIREEFQSHEVCLLHGVTSSGKTEIYMKLIRETLDRGEQVLYLLPEIALTTHIIERLRNFFGDHISVFHSRYSVNERVEVWNNLLEKKEKTGVILGARSSVLLPFDKLGLIIVDEEHDSSYKQFDPAPRYQARDTAIMMGHVHGAKVLLGSATPSIESYDNTREGKYGLVELQERYGQIMLPEIELVDIKEKYRKKRMSGHFSDRLIKLVEEALAAKKQVILFQNRRGFSPVVECKTCGVSPQCPNCDVSLTFHKYRNELRCHYCGHSRPLPSVCPACDSPTLDTKGFGTEQIETELQTLFPQARSARMDLDTTRGKYAYQKLLHDFQTREVDILVGTQMLTKGLDFGDVSLVGVLNADNLLNFPDFRAHERTFQLMVQVSGRSGRSGQRGKVAIQTFNPYHVILQQVSMHDYLGMFREQLEERRQFSYPPYVRLIRITLKDRDYNKVEEASKWMGTALHSIYGERILGPTTPGISRIRNKYIRTLLLKIPKGSSLKVSKDQLFKVRNTFKAIPQFKSIRLTLDVDPQ